MKKIINILTLLLLMLSIFVCYSYADLIINNSENIMPYSGIEDKEYSKPKTSIKNSSLSEQSTKALAVYITKLIELYKNDEGNMDSILMYIADSIINELKMYIPNITEKESKLFKKEFLETLHGAITARDATDKTIEREIQKMLDKLMDKMQERLIQRMMERIMERINEQIMQKVEEKLKDRLIESKVSGNLYELFYAEDQNAFAKSIGVSITADGKIEVLIYMNSENNDIVVYDNVTILQKDKTLILALVPIDEVMQLAKENYINLVALPADKISNVSNVINFDSGLSHTSSFISGFTGNPISTSSGGSTSTGN